MALRWHCIGTGTPAGVRYAVVVFFTRNFLDKTPADEVLPPVVKGFVCHLDAHPLGQGLSPNRRTGTLGRNLKHLITLLDDLQALGVAFISLAEGIDATTPAGKLQMHILGAIAEFERGRIVERVRAGLARAQAQGVRLGRPRRRIDPERPAAVAGLPDREAARRLGIPRSTFQRLTRNATNRSGGL